MARRVVSNKKKPLIVICSEGGKKSSEYYYFRNFACRGLRIQFSTGNNTDPLGMLEDLLKYIKNEDIKSETNCHVYLVIDTDLNKIRIDLIKLIEEKCKENNIEIITSSPTFEIWFLMHFRSNKLIFQSSKEVKKELKNILGNYKEGMDIYKKIVNKTDDACKIAKTLAKNNSDKLKDIIINNPHTNIYKIIEVINEYKSIN